MRRNFVHFDKLSSNTICIAKENLDLISSNKRCIISKESDIVLNLLSLGNRNVSSLEFDKNSKKFALKKSWTFFSDKIKIIFENNGDVFFLNSDQKLCVTNLNNQSLVNILSEMIFDQAVMFGEDKSGIKFIAAERDKKLIVLQLSKTEIIHSWEIESDSIVSNLNLRGQYLFAYTTNQSLIIYLTGKGEDKPFEMVKVNSENFSSSDVLSREDESLILLTYNYSDPEGKICLINTAEKACSDVTSFTENLLSRSKTEYGRFLCFSGKLSQHVRHIYSLLVGTKIIKASKFDIAKNNYYFQNICRNMYGEVIQVKYFEDSHGVAYFLSLHRKYALIFIIETCRSASLEISLLKSVPFPDNEFIGENLEIAVSGSDKVYLRDYSNAYEIPLGAGFDEESLADHCLPLKISTLDLILIILSRQDIHKLDFQDFRDYFSDHENVAGIEYAFKVVNQYRTSTDIFATKVIILSILRYKFASSPRALESIKETLDYEIQAAAKSDSQVNQQFQLFFDSFL